MFIRIKQIIDFVLWATVISLPLLFSLHDLSNVFSPFKFPFLIAYSSVLIVLLLSSSFFTEVKWDFIDTMLLILLLVLWASTLMSDDLELGIVGKAGNIGRYEGALSITAYFVVFFAARKHLRITTKKIVVFISLLSLVSVYALFQFFKWDPLVTYYKFPPIVFSTIGNPNFVGTFALILTVFTMGLYVSFRKWFYLFFSLLFSTTLMVSETRSAWLAFIVVVLIYLVYLWSKKKAFVPLLLFLGMSLGINYILILNQPKTPKPVATKAKEIKKQVDVTNEYAGSGRLKIWEISLGVIKDHPLVGCGPEQLKNTLKKEKKEDYIAYKKYKGNTIDRAHNEYLQHAINSGIPYLIIYMALVMFCIVNAFKHVRTNPFLESALLVVVAYLFQAFFNISVIAVAPIFWFFLGILAMSESNFPLLFQKLKKKDVAKE